MGISYSLIAEIAATEQPYAIGSGYAKAEVGTLLFGYAGAVVEQRSRMHGIFGSCNRKLKLHILCEIVQKPL